MKQQDRILIPIAGADADGTRLDGELPASILGVDEPSLVCDSPLRYELRAAAVGGGALVSGRVSTTVSCVCDRCLNKFDVEIENPEVCHFIENPLPSELDLTDEIREDMVVVLPRRCLCDENCRGLCPGCGRDLNHGDCECESGDGKPGVWDELDGLFS